ncbi:hypothetical protein JXM83_04790 [Candidatus Woesearchaeota archaeon]|nr:hypothetical protein [Candidatus Woesearchaeota archaeon]
MLTDIVESYNGLRTELQSDLSGFNGQLELAIFDMLYNIEIAHETKKEGVKDILDSLGIHTKNPGLTVIIGYDTTKHDNSYLFNGTRFDNPIPVLVENNGAYEVNPDAYNLIVKASKKDYATIIDVKGNIIATGVFINKVSLDNLAKQLGYQDSKNGKLIDKNGEELFAYEAFGFGEPVGTRQSSAIYATNRFEGSKAYTLSENEYDCDKIPHLRRMENSRVTHSTNQAEGYKAKKY